MLQGGLQVHKQNINTVIAYFILAFQYNAAMERMAQQGLCRVLDQWDL